MGVLNTVKELFAASTQNPNRGGVTEQSKGAYWCHDCSERILDLHVEVDGVPDCPACGEAMDFERSVSSTGCAC
jgi:Zn finger protein HypA/HybF involved in hydrogenase expression